MTFPFRIVGFDIPKEALAHQIMVPTTDTVRSAFLLQTMVASEYHVLYSGLTGTGKTVAPTSFVPISLRNHHKAS